MGYGSEPFGITIRGIGNLENVVEIIKGYSYIANYLKKPEQNVSFLVHI